MRVSVRGMTGQGCARQGGRALEAAGAAEIHMDVSRARAIFAFDRYDTSRLTAAIEDAGYEPGRVATVEGDIAARPPGGCCGGIAWRKQRPSGQEEIS